MIDFISANYKGIVTKKKAPKIPPECEKILARQDFILGLIKDKAMYVSEINKVTGNSLQSIRTDIHHLISRGLAVDLRVNGGIIYVKAAGDE